MKLNTLDKALLFVAILDVLFVIAMIMVFCIFQSVPDSLIIAVFGATFGECGCCAAIWRKKWEGRYESSSSSGSDIDLPDNSVHSGGENG